MKANVAYYHAGAGTDESRVVEVPINARIHRTVIDVQRNEAVSVYEAKGFRPLRTESELASALAEVRSTGERVATRRAEERASVADVAAQVTAKAAALAVREALGSPPERATRRTG